MSVPHSLHAPLNADKLLRRQLHLEYYMNVSYSGEESKHSARLLGRQRGTWVIRNWHNSRKLLTGAEAGQEHQRLEEEEGRSRRRHVVNRCVCPPGLGIYGSCKTRRRDDVSMVQ